MKEFWDVAQKHCSGDSNVTGRVIQLMRILKQGERTV